MAETFIIDTPAADVATIDYQESDDGLTGWTDIETGINAQTLPDDPGGGKQVIIAAGDTTKYARLVPVSASGIKRASDATILPPRPAVADSFTVFANARDAGLSVEPDFVLLGEPCPGFSVAGDNMIVDSTSDTTDANGFAQITLPADSGFYQVLLGPKPIRKRIDTAGRDGQVVNFKDLQDL